MNDPKGLFNNEPSYFDTLLNSWRDNLQKNELYRKLTTDTFDINSVNKERVSQVTPLR